MENIEEEVMKALEFKALHDAKIAYIDGAACKHIFVEQILEYVKKLQAENKRLRKTALSAIEESRAYELDNENMQNAIERLTEAMNDFRQEVITLNNEKLKLQKQVDELTERNAKYLESIESLTVGKCVLRCELTRQAVKEKVAEFAERLKKDHSGMEYDCDGEHLVIVLDEDELDEIAKELTGGEK